MWYSGPVATDQHGMVGQADDLPFRETARDRVRRRLAGLLVDDVEDFTEGAPLGLGRGPAGERLRHGIEVLHDRASIGRDDGVADGMQRDLGALLLVEQSLLGLLALGDVSPHADDGNDLAPLIQHRFVGPPEPAPTCLGQGPLLVVIPKGRPEQIFHGPGRRLPVLFMHQRHEGLAQQFRFGLAEDLAIRRGHEQEAVFGIHLDEEVGLILNQQAVFLLACS